MNLAECVGLAAGQTFEEWVMACKHAGAHDATIAQWHDAKRRGELLVSLRKEGDKGFVLRVTKGGA